MELAHAVPGAPRAALAGLILCGGASRRMGSDKALMRIDGERLVDRAVRRLGTVADPVILAVGARPLEVAGAVAVPDPAGHLGDGPLAGLVAGLRRSPHPLTAVVAVDMPFAHVGLLADMATAWTGEDAVVALSASGPEPLHAVYSRTALPALEAALTGGRLRLLSVLGELRVREMDGPGSLFAANLNTPGDVVTLERSRQAGG